MDLSPGYIHRDFKPKRIVMHLLVKPGAIHCMVRPLA